MEVPFPRQPVAAAAESCFGAKRKMLCSPASCDRPLRHRAGDGEGARIKVPGACLAQLNDKGSVVSRAGWARASKAPLGAAPSSHPIMLGPFLKLRVLWRPFHSQNET